MAFYVTKFELLRYGHNEELKTLTNYLTPNAENIIDVKDALRDLGVIMNEKSYIIWPCGQSHYDLLHFSIKYSVQCTVYSKA